MPKKLVSTTRLTGMAGLPARVRIYSDGSFEADAGPLSLSVRMSKQEARDVCDGLSKVADNGAAE